MNIIIFEITIPCVSWVPDPLSLGSGSPQKPQPSPGGQSSCSSDHSPLGSTTNNDSGVEMAGNAGGSYEDLSTLEDVVPGEPVGTSGLMALHKLENLRIDKLKQLRKPAASKGLNLPPIPGAGEIRVPLPLGCGAWHMGSVWRGLVGSERFPHLAGVRSGPKNLGKPQSPKGVPRELERDFE